MQADFKVVIDACVLANIAVCDLFLRLAEKPRLFIPKWSQEILNETQGVQLNKLGWPVNLVDSWRREIERCFPDAQVDGYQHLIPYLQNDPKDRHVLAAAISAGASVVVTFNLKDFRSDLLAPWKVEAIHPQDYLLTLYFMSPEIVVQRLNDIARKRNKEMIDLVLMLGRSLPNFSAHLISDLGLEV